jgi:hypothetical protein
MPLFSKARTPGKIGHCQELFFGTTKGRLEIVARRRVPRATQVGLCANRGAAAMESV